MSRTIRTPEKEAAILQEIRATGNVEKACSKLRVGKTTWYDWKANDPELEMAHQEAMTAGREAKADTAEDALATRIAQGDTTAIIFTLKTLRRDIYGDRQVLEHTGPNGSPLLVTFADRPDGPA